MEANIDTKWSLRTERWGTSGGQETRRNQRRSPRRSSQCDRRGGSPAGAEFWEPEERVVIEGDDQLDITAADTSKRWGLRLGHESAQAKGKSWAPCSGGIREAASWPKGQRNQEWGQSWMGERPYYIPGNSDKRGAEKGVVSELSSSPPIWCICKYWQTPFMSSRK